MTRDLSSTRSAARREPAIDGLRALCVAAVVLYHLPVRGLPGGFLAVSAFFTLSGFLITRLLLDELRDTGTVRLRRFTARRLRRLMPAATAVVLGATLAWAASGRGIETGDTVAALGYVSNWWQLAQGHGYAELFREPSPFQHYWSLAIEEQFYLVFPVLALALFRITRRRAAPFAVALGALAAGSFALSAAAPFDTAYTATHTRAGEILVGSILAVVLSTARGARGTARVMSSRPGTALGLAALAGSILLWCTVGLGSPALFPWATLASSVATAVLVAECCYGHGVRRLLVLRPAVALGRISYGVYLVHWPVFVLTGPGRVALPDPARHALRVGLAVALAAALFRVLEEPVRQGVRWRRRVLPVALASLSLAAVSATTLLAAPRPDLIDTAEIASARDRLLTMAPAAAAAEPPARPQGATETGRRTEPAVAEGGSGELAGPPVATAAARVEPSLGRILFVGDSTSWSLSLGVTEALAAEGIDVSAFPAVGCGIGGDTPIEYLNLPAATSTGCAEWYRQLPEVIRRFDPDVVFVVGGVADLSDREVPGVGWSHIGEPGFDAWLLDRMGHAVDLLGAGGARVVWATLPHLAVVPNPGFTGEPPFVENEPQRAERYNALIARVAAEDERVDVLDFAGYLRTRPGGEFAPGLRPDGVHIDSRDFPDITRLFVDTARLAAPGGEA